MSSLAVVRRFVAAVNERDPAALAALIAADHRFVDSLGAVLAGRDTVVRAWRQYFAMVPDYRIVVDRWLVDGAEVVLLGRAGGTYTSDGTPGPEGAWETPAAWRAVVADDALVEWQVFADNEPLRQCMRRASV